MKAVGIKELKARLSEYVRQAREGETVLVTDRDEVVAELRPARLRPAGESTAESVLDDLAGTGEVSRAALDRRGFAWKPKGLGLKSGTALSILDEIRADSA
ncbi:MAG: type II toxin-antitoxin system prevent-host-death family antitoxin [Planctomycetota bacterium]